MRPIKFSVWYFLSLPFLYLCLSQTLCLLITLRYISSLHVLSLHTVNTFDSKNVQARFLERDHGQAEFFQVLIKILMLER